MINLLFYGVRAVFLGVLNGSKFIMGYVTLDPIIMLLGDPNSYQT